MASRPMFGVFSDILLLYQERNEVFRELSRIIRMLRMQANIEQVVKGAMGCNNAHVAYTNTFVSVRFWQTDIGVRNPEREAMLLL